MVYGQKAETLIDAYLAQNLDELLTVEYKVIIGFVSRTSKVWQIFLDQTVNGIPVLSTTSSIYKRKGNERVHEILAFFSLDVKI